MALGQILSRAVSHQEHQSAPQVRSTSTPVLSGNLNRLISAAVVSPRFRHLLFSNPIAALAAGYNGETFQLTAAEYAAVTSSKASTISEFAAQLIDLQQCVEAEAEQKGETGCQLEGDISNGWQAKRLARHIGPTLAHAQSNVAATEGYRPA